MSSSRLLIGEASTRAGVSRKALKHYEAMGIIPAPVRSRARYREYDPRVLKLLDFVAQARRLGFTLERPSSG